MSPKKPGYGHKGVVDVVLGAQWGDEGKGKLVRLRLDHLEEIYVPCHQPRFHQHATSKAKNGFR